MELEKAIEILKSIDVLDDIELEEAIETVLTELKEKQKLIDELEKDTRNRVVGCRDLAHKCKKCTLKECIGCEYTSSDIEKTFKNFVCQDKIIEKIEELSEKTISETDETTLIRYNIEMNILQELLEEN